MSNPYVKVSIETASQWAKSAGFVCRIEPATDCGNSINKHERFLLENKYSDERMTYPDPAQLLAKYSLNGTIEATDLHVTQKSFSFFFRFLIDPTHLDWWIETKKVFTKPELGVVLRVDNSGELVAMLPFEIDSIMTAPQACKTLQFNGLWQPIWGHVVPDDFVNYSKPASEEDCEEYKRLIEDMGYTVTLYKRVPQNAFQVRKDKMRAAMNTP